MLPTNRRSTCSVRSIAHTPLQFVRLLCIGLVAALTAGSVCAQDSGGADPLLSREMFQTFEVSGTGVHYFTTAIVHEQTPTETGMIQRSTDLIRLEGDIDGIVLYHPRSEFDFAAGTLVNTGHQVFSGSILGSRPVMLHDDSFRFDVNLATGETVGRVLLVDGIAGPRTRCRLDVFGTGMTPDGDAMVGYTGICRVNPRIRIGRGE